MDPSSLLKLKKLREDTTKKEVIKEPVEDQVFIDPSLFFTQLPGIVEELPVEDYDDDIFGSMPAESVDPSLNKETYEEDDLFGSAAPEISASFNLEEEAKAENAMIKTLEEQLLATKLIDPKAAAKQQDQDTSAAGYSNGSTSYQLDTPKTQAALITAARKKVKKSQHSDKELEGVSEYELVLIKLLLSKIK